MNKTEALALVTWVSQSDGRVTVADATVQIWENALQTATVAEARSAIMDHYRMNETQATPYGIRRRVEDHRAHADAQQSAHQHAIEAAAPVRTMAFSDYVRHVDRPEYAALFEAGRRDGNAHRAYKRTLRETGSRELARAAGDRARQS